VKLLEVLNLHVSFALPGGGECHAARGVGLHVGPGDRLGVVGESGSGKSTVAMAAMGLLPSNASVSGEILIDGEEALTGGEQVMRRHRWKDIAIVFQGSMNALNPVKTVGAQIIEPMALHGVARGRSARTRTSELLDLVGLVPSVAARYPHECSGGMRQRAGLAMALACEPKLLIADEPTTALDVIVQAQLLELLMRLVDDRGLALVLITHDLPVVAQLCNRVAVMRAGEVVETGPLDRLRSVPAHPYTRQLFDAVPDLYATHSEEGGSPEAAASTVMDRADTHTPRRAAAPTTDPPGPLLDVAGLVVHYPVRRSLSAVVARRPRKLVHAVDGVSLHLRDGELLAVVGESGCGKTTLAHGILRLIGSKAGSVRFDGEDVTSLSRRRLRDLRRRAQLVYQDPYESLDPRFRVRQTMEEPLLIHGLGSSRAERRELILDALVGVELDPPDPWLERHPHELSGGQRQRIAIAAALILRPALLVADEPVSMLDVSVRAGVLGLLAKLRDQEALAVLMITHDLSTAARFADRIAIMYLGRIVEEGPAREVIHDPLHPYTRALLAAVPRLEAGTPQSPRIVASSAPDPIDVPAGCRFHPRCPVAQERCQTIDPVLRPATPEGGDHRAACVLVGSP